MVHHRPSTSTVTGITCHVHSTVRGKAGKVHNRLETIMFWKVFCRILLYGQQIGTCTVGTLGFFAGACFDEMNVWPQNPWQIECSQFWNVLLNSLCHRDKITVRGSILNRDKTSKRVSVESSFSKALLWRQTDFCTMPLPCVKFNFFEIFVLIDVAFITS